MCIAAGSKHHFRLYVRARVFVSSISSLSVNICTHSRSNDIPSAGMKGNRPNGSICSRLQIRELLCLSFNRLPKSSEISLELLCGLCKWHNVTKGLILAEYFLENLMHSTVSDFWRGIDFTSILMMLNNSTGWESYGEAYKLLMKHRNWKFISIHSIWNNWVF